MRVRPRVARFQLLTGVALLPFASITPAAAETFCSQAADGAVECVEGGIVVATGTMTPSTVQNGPGLVAMADGAVDTIVGSITGTINTDAEGETAVSLQARREVDMSLGDITSNGNGVFGNSIHASLSLVTGDVSSSNGRGIFVSGHDLSVSCGNVQGAGEHGTGLFLLGSGNFSIDCGNVSTQGDFSTGVTATSHGSLVASVGDVATSGLGSRGLTLAGRSAQVSVGDITTDGMDADALVIVSSVGNLTVTSGDVTTEQQGSQAVALESGRNLIARLGNISTNGSQSAAVTVRAFGTALVAAGDVSTAGDESTAAHIRGDDVTVRLGDVTTEGASSGGVFVDAGTDATVTVGDVTTTGPNSFGIDVTAVNSVDLTCGSVATTGADSTGVRAIGTEFFANASVNCGNISTTGEGSWGVFASANAHVDVIVGDVISSGRGIIAGSEEAGLVIRAGNVTTTGDDADGIYGDVGDSGGSITCDSVTTLGADSDGIEGFASDGRISTTCGSVRTEGDRSAGVLHWSDGLLTIGEVTTLGYNSSGVVMSSPFGSIADIGSVTTSGSNSAGIVSSFSGFTGLTVGSVTTSGDDSVGIRVRPDGDVDLNLGQIVTSGANSHGIDVTTGFYSSSISVNVAGVEVAGADADAVRILPESGSADPVAIDLTATGDIRSADGRAVAIATTQDFDFAVFEGAEVSGRTGGILVEAGSTMLDIAGAVRASEGAAVQAVGGPATVNIASTGTVDGSMTFGAGADAVINAGFVTARGINDFGGGDDLFTNSNMLVVDGTIGFAGLERFANVGGIIDMQDGVPGDRLDLSGDYSGSAGAAVLLDVSRSLDVADVLAIGGAVTGETILSLNWVDSNTPINAGGVLIVEGVSDPDAFTVEGLDDFGLFALTLRERDGDLFLMAAIDPAATDYALLGVVAADSWYQSFDAVRASVAGRGSFLPKLGFWAQAYGGSDRSGERGTADLFGARIETSSLVETDRLGGQIGFDGSVGAVLVGATAGYEKSKADAGLATDVDATGWNVGAYVGIGAAVGPYALATVKHDRLDLDVDAPKLTPGDVDAHSTGGDLELGWRGSLAALSFDVGAGLSAVRTSVDRFAIDGTNFDPGSDTSVRGRIGGRATFNGPLRPFAEAHVFHEFGEGSDLAIVSGDIGEVIDSGDRGTWARIEAGIGGANDRALISAWLNFGDREGWGLRAGFKF